MNKVNTVNKIIDSYFAAVTLEIFAYSGKIYTPKPLKVSPLLLRCVDCLANCGACCLKYSLDYLPTEKKPDTAIRRQLVFKGNQVEIYTDNQATAKGRHCRYLDETNGRCKIHTYNAFGCDFELVRFLHYEKYNTLMTRLYGRKWNMLRCDNVRGGLCTISSKSNNVRKDITRKFLRLQDWTKHFNLKTKIPQILDLVNDPSFNKTVTF